MQPALHSVALVVRGSQDFRSQVVRSLGVRSPNLRSVQLAVDKQSSVGDSQVVADSQVVDTPAGPHWVAAAVERDTVE